MRQIQEDNSLQQNFIPKKKKKTYNKIPLKKKTKKQPTTNSSMQQNRIDLSKRHSCKLKNCNTRPARLHLNSPTVR